MKLVVFISSESWASTAGVRIRYKRLIPTLAKLGWTLELSPVPAVRGTDKFDADLYLFSKCHDARSVALAAHLRAKGRRIGIDVFDDYYSQVEDSRFVHLRRWFADITPFLDFALCATPPMQTRLAKLLPDLPVHCVNDPFERFDKAHIGKTVARNAARARADKVLRIGWFGIGDNPNFSLGLSDLHAFSPMLAQARTYGYEPQLEILANSRSFTAERLEMLARMPLSYTLGEWSSEAEAALIARSLVCFLPVNAQPFSTVKSLNRGITTLMGGAQLLSAGYPLYQTLGAFCYRDMGRLIGDLESDTLRLRTDRLDTLEGVLDTHGHPAREAEKLIAFLEGLKVPVPQKASHQPFIILHGINSPCEIHKSAQRMRWLSVGSEGFRGRLNFDLSILTEQPDAEVVWVRLSERAQQYLIEGDQWQSRPAELANGREALDIALPADRIAGTVPGSLKEAGDLMAPHILAYQRYISRMEGVIDLLFTPQLVVLSERSPPFWVAGAAQRNTENRAPGERIDAT